MKLTYAPKGQDPQTFDFDPDDLGSLEAEALEEAGGSQWDSFGQWVNLYNQGGFRAWRAALWIMLRRHNPDLGFEEVLPKVGELLVTGDDAKTPAEESLEGKDEPAADDTNGT